MHIPLWASGDMMKYMAMNGVMALFFGFLHFVQFKRGYKPNFPYDDGVSFFEHDNIIPDFEDSSWWVKNLEHPDMNVYSFYENTTNFPPNFFKQYINKKNEKHTICILIDTFSFFECGKILNETKLDDEHKYSLPDVEKEFHFRSDKYQRSYALSYFNPKYFEEHILIFRPSKLVEYISMLNEYFSSLEDFPEQIVRNEEWSKMSMIEHVGIYGKSELVFCKEENIRELLRKHSIKIPNVEFVTFYEYLKDKLDPGIRKEWENIRDRYISNLKTSIIEPHLSNDYSKAKEFLREARNSFEKKNYNESAIHSTNGIVKALDIFLKCPEIGFSNKIKLLESHKELRKYISKLNFIRIHRNDTYAHPQNLEFTDMNTAEYILQTADDFLAELQKTI